MSYLYCKNESVLYLSLEKRSYLFVLYSQEWREYIRGNILNAVVRIDCEFFKSGFH